MSKPWTIGAQLSTSHSSPDLLKFDEMVAAVERTRSILDLEILVLGAREIPEIFSDFTKPATRPAKQIFVWYNLLADFPGVEDRDLVVNWRGERSRGWSGWVQQAADVDETFRFVCPNNPAVRRKAVERLRALLERYPFDGVFVDKMRFPSPANGLEDVLSCFCDHCRAGAATRGLNLGDVARTIEQTLRGEVPLPARGAPDEGLGWLADLFGAGSPFARFLRFRLDSVTGLIAELHAAASDLGRKVALDLFSPCLAPLVGQDYGRLAAHAAWVKPMTYRVANGPAGLRLELPALVDGVTRLLGPDEASIISWASRHVRGVDEHTLPLSRSAAVPMDLMVAEFAAAVRLAPTVPVYFGLELVCHPGVIDITPELVRDMVRAGLEANVAGTIVSWDLMHAPLDGLRALAAST
jgi:hypothetical protein